MVKISLLIAFFTISVAFYRGFFTSDIKTEEKENNAKTEEEKENDAKTEDISSSSSSSSPQEGTNIEEPSTNIEELVSSFDFDFQIAVDIFISIKMILEYLFF